LSRVLDLLLAEITTVNQGLTNLLERKAPEFRFGTRASPDRDTTLSYDLNKL
jgi:hypothetical protein